MSIAWFLMTLQHRCWPLGNAWSICWLIVSLCCHTVRSDRETDAKVIQSCTNCMVICEGVITTFTSTNCSSSAPVSEFIIIYISIFLNQPFSSHPLWSSAMRQLIWVWKLYALSSYACILLKMGRKSFVAPCKLFDLMGFRSQRCCCHHNFHPSCHRQ